MFTKDRHRTVDRRSAAAKDGAAPEPLFEAVEFLLGSSMGDATAKRELDSNTAIVLLGGWQAVQAKRRGLAQRADRIYLRKVRRCGRRVAEHLVTGKFRLEILSCLEANCRGVNFDAITRLRLSAGK